MLIVTRKYDEVINIGAEIEVKVLGIKEGQVRLGVKAPKDIPVHREEIYKRIHAEKESK